MATVSTTTGTYLKNLFNPQVVGDRINKKLFDLIRFSPLARVDNTLVGRPGDKITLPYYNKSVTAALVPEGTDIPISQLTEATTSVQIKKFGAGVQITDEALLSAYGDPLGEAIDQIARAIADAVDNDMLTIMGSAPTATGVTAGALTADMVADALTAFGEDIDGDKVLLVNPAAYATIRKANGWIPGTDVAANLIMRGTVGMLYGCQVVVSNKLTANKAAYIVKPGALAIYNKREIMVENDRDIINKSTVITADKHFANYLYDSSKIIKLPEE
jgi:N4-gp56 family major capsid protein